MWVANPKQQPKGLPLAWECHDGARRPAKSPSANIYPNPK
jgi:hypothetical protein